MGIPAMPTAPTPTALSSERRSEGSEPIFIAIYSLWFMDNPPPDTAWGAELTPSPMMDPRRCLRQGVLFYQPVGNSDIFTLASSASGTQHILASARHPGLRAARTVRTPYVNETH